MKPIVILSCCILLVVCFCWLCFSIVNRSKNHASRRALRMNMTHEAERSPDSLTARIALLMSEEQLFLQKNLKIGDVASLLGVCRTYVSGSINASYGCSFSDYVNSLRVEYAKQLLSQSGDIKMFSVADKAGFSSEQSFYRNFKKFTGKTPAQWIENITILHLKTEKQ